MTEPMTSIAPGIETDIQRTYYRDTAKLYDTMHVEKKDEHYFALRILEAIIDLHDIKSVLDIGAGTGRVARHLKAKNPNLKILSIEPVAELREIGYSHGLSREELVEGDVNKLALMDGEFDLVTEFGVLHHVKDPA